MMPSATENGMNQLEKLHNQIHIRKVSPDDLCPPVKHSYTKTEKRCSYIVKEKTSSLVTSSLVIKASFASTYFYGNDVWGIALHLLNKNPFTLKSRASSYR